MNFKNVVKIFFTKIGKKWAIKLTCVVFWENSNAKIGYKFNILKDNAISQKMQYAKLNKFQLELMGKLQWDFFFGTEEVIAFEGDTN